MKHHNIPQPSYKIFFIAILLSAQFLALVAFPARTQACTQVPTQWWFHEKMTITDDILPEALSVSLRYTDYAESRPALVLSNNSTETLYILAPEGSADYYSLAEPAGVPQDLIVHNTVTQLESHFQMDQLARLDSNLKDVNQWHPKQPENVAIPTSQSTRINLLFDGQLYFLNLDIDYKVNDNFNSNWNGGGCPDFYQPQAEQEVPNYISFTLLGAFGLIALAGVTIIYRRRANPGKWLE